MKSRRGEGSASDKRQDRAEAKRRGISMKAVEKTAEARIERVAEWAKRVRWLSAAEMDAKLAMARANGRLPPEGLDAYLAQLGDA